MAESRSIGKVAFLGLGVMGYPMAGHLARYLARNGHSNEHSNGQNMAVAVYNRSPARAAKFTEQYRRYGVRACAQIAEAVDQADVVLCCVGNDNDVRQVLKQPDGALPHMKPTAILVDHTTTSAQLALEMDETAGQQGVHFVDAPISGGQSGAENGCLTVMCGGKAEVFEQLQSRIFPAYAKSATLMGGCGQGQRAKMIKPDLHQRRAERVGRGAAAGTKIRPGRSDLGLLSQKRGGRVLADGEPGRDHGRRPL